MASSNCAGRQRTTLQRKSPPVTLMPMSVSVRMTARPRAIQCASVSGRSTCLGSVGDANEPFMLCPCPDLNVRLQRSAEKAWHLKAGFGSASQGRSWVSLARADAKRPGAGFPSAHLSPRLILVIGPMTRGGEHVEINLCQGSTGLHITHANDPRGMTAGCCLQTAPCGLTLACAATCPRFVDEPRVSGPDDGRPRRAQTMARRAAPAQASASGAVTSSIRSMRTRMMRRLPTSRITKRRSWRTSASLTSGSRSHWRNR